MRAFRSGLRTRRWPPCTSAAPREARFRSGTAGLLVGGGRVTGMRVGLDAIEAGRAVVAPGLGPATLVETRVCSRPAGPDLNPMLGGIAGLDGLVIGYGLGASA